MTGQIKGNAYWNYKRKDGKTEGIVFIYDIKYQNLNAKIKMELKSDNKFTGKAYDFQPISEGNPKEANIKGEILENGEEIKGEWDTDVGIKGKMYLFKHKETFINPIPTAFLSKPVSSPPCKLDARELAGLILLMAKDINTAAQPTFTINYRGVSFF